MGVSAQFEFSELISKCILLTIHPSGPTIELCPTSKLPFMAINPFLGRSVDESFNKGLVLKIPPLRECVQLVGMVETDLSDFRREYNSTGDSWQFSDGRGGKNEYIG